MEVGEVREVVEVDTGRMPAATGIPRIAISSPPRGSIGISCSAAIAAASRAASATASGLSAGSELVVPLLEGVAVRSHALRENLIDQRCQGAVRPGQGA